MTAQKLAVVVCDDIEMWQELNVAVFVTSGLSGVVPGLIGEDYIDGSGVRYPPKFGVPCRILTGSRDAVKRAFNRALSRNLTVSVFTQQLFSTRNDAENRAAVAAVPTDELDVVGFAVVGVAKDVDKALDKLRPHQ